VCGLRICGNNCGLTANGFFIQRSTCCAHNE